MTEDSPPSVDLPELGEELLVETDNSERPEDGEQDVPQAPAAPDPGRPAAQARRAGGAAASADDVLRHAATELGTVEGPNNATEYAAEAGHAPHQPWCATFLVAMFRRAGMRLPNESAYTPTMYQGLRREGCVIGGPERGHSASCTSPAWVGSPTSGSWSPFAATGAS